MDIIKNIKKSLVSRAYLRNELDRQLYLYKADQLTQKAQLCIDNGLSKDRYFDYDVIVSLTTYGRRFYDVYLAIESIMQGTCKPNKIILWLQDEFKGVELPIYLQKQVSRGLEVGYCKDLRSYKKIIPTLKAYPEAAIITVDDDVIYKEDMIEKLISAHRKERFAICGNNVHKIAMISDRKILPYSKWSGSCEEMIPSFKNFCVGVGGILYPPHCFNDEVTNEKEFMSICPYADDIWLYAMTVTNHYKPMKTISHGYYEKDYYSNETFQEESLSNLNLVQNGGGGNDTQLKNVFDKYNVYQYLCQE